MIRQSEEMIERELVPWPDKLDVIGVAVSPTDYSEAVTATMNAAQRRQGGVVSCHAVHGIVLANRDSKLRSMVNSFDLLTPDGQPVRWALNLLHGVGLRERVYGPELTLRLCQQAVKEDVSIYLYGGSSKTVERLRENLQREYPGLRIAGYESPPYRALSSAEDEQVVHRINESGAGIVFIGLGCPKQDVFAFEHRNRIAGVQVCVGAAFDFHAGVKNIAPAWMQRRGLEWLYRMYQEPRRLWRRYLGTNTLFVSKVTWAMVRKCCTRSPRVTDGRNAETTPVATRSQEAGA